MESRFLTLLIVSLLFTGIVAKAQAARDKLRLEYYGIWASPDCGNYSQAIIFTENYMLKSSEAVSQLSPVRQLERKKDYTVAEFEGEARPLQRSEDGLLLVGTPDKAPDVWPDTWGALALSGHSEYSHCEITPAVIPVPLVRAMENIEGVRTACADELTAACGKVLFKIVDTNGNDRLSAAEFRKAGALLGTFAPLVEGKSVETFALEDAYRRGAEAGGVLFGEALAARDANGSGDLDIKEMTDFQRAAKDDAALHAMTEALATLFPAFK